MRQNKGLEIFSDSIRSEKALDLNQAACRWPSIGIKPLAGIALDNQQHQRERALKALRNALTATFH
jgi:hypothetical protein